MIMDRRDLPCAVQSMDPMTMEGTTPPNSVGSVFVPHHRTNSRRDVRRPQSWEGEQDKKRYR